MTRTVYTHEHHNCGDQIMHLHLVRALAKQHPEVDFVHFCNGCHLPNLMEMVSEIPNIRLEFIESVPQYSIGVWKNEQNAWVDSPLRWQWSEYYLWWHKVVARKMGFESPFTCREHLLLDYPALDILDPGDFKYDFLIGDSAPSSGQFSEWADHSKEPMRPLIQALLDQKKYKILLTSEAKAVGATISNVGRVSQRCRHHIMIPNGPFWPTLNVHNHHHHEGRRRIVLLDNGEELSMPHIQQCRSVAEVMEIARTEGWI